MRRANTRGALLIMGLALAFCLCTPSGRAKAQELEIAIGTGVALSGAVALGFAIADTVSFATDSPWDDGWAAAEVAVASVFLTAWAAFSIAALESGLGNDAYGLWRTYLACSVAPGAIGAYLLGHAVWSLVENDDAAPVHISLGPRRS